jgi:hypothetical protein
LIFLVTAVTPGSRLASAQDAPGPWDKPINFSQLPDTVSYAPQMLCDWHQNLHIFWLERDEQSATLFYRNNVNGGWSQPFDILLSDVIANFSVALDKNDILHMVFLDRNRGGVLSYTSAPLYYAWNARAWSHPVVLAAEVSSGSISAHNGDELWVTYTQADVDGFSHVSSYIRSSDLGATWTEPVNFLSTLTPLPSAVNVKLAVDAAGRYHVAWNERSFEYGAHSRLGYMRSSDQGNTWDINQVLAQSNTPPGVAVLDLTIFGEEEIHLTWDQPERLHKWSADGGETWTEPQLIVALGAAFGGVNALTKDSSDRMYAVAAVGDGVYQVPWNGSTWSAPDIIDDRFIDAHGQLMLACGGNHLHTVYYDRIGEQELWYSTKVVNSPEWAQSPLPVPASVNNLPGLLPTPTPSAVDSVNVRVLPTPLPANLLVMRDPPSQTRPTIAGILGALTVIVLAMFIRRRRQWSR